MTDEGRHYVRFTDRSGHTGKITDDLALEYDGRYEPSIETALSELDPSHSDSEDGERRRAVLCDLIIDLPETTPITSMELHEREPR